MSTQVGSQAKALNKINWDKDGRRTAIGSSDGRVHIYDIGEVIFNYTIIYLESSHFIEKKFFFFDSWHNHVMMNGKSCRKRFLK